MLNSAPFNSVQSPKTLKYVQKYDTKNVRCNRCGHVVLVEPNKTEAGYPYQCMFCDENLFGIETYLGKPHSDEEFNALCCDTRDLLLLDN